jgi:hypothetical protein
MSDLRPNIAFALAAFGVGATVTLPGGSPIATTVIWLSPVAVDTPGVIHPTNVPQPALALSRADVPNVPRGTLVEAPERAGGIVRSWIVEAVLGMTADEVRVIVIPGES